MKKCVWLILIGWIALMIVTFLISYSNPNNILGRDCLPNEGPLGTGCMMGVIINWGAVIRDLIIFTVIYGILIFLARFLIKKYSKKSKKR
jgi:hypothetical protein